MQPGISSVQSLASGKLNHVTNRLIAEPAASPSDPMSMPSIVAGPTPGRLSPPILDINDDLPDPDRPSTATYRSVRVSRHLESTELGPPLGNDRREQQRNDDGGAGKRHDHKHQRTTQQTLTPSRLTFGSSLRCSPTPRSAGNLTSADDPPTPPSWSRLSRAPPLPPCIRQVAEQV